jgi:hypothetical protein
MTAAEVVSSRAKGGAVRTRIVVVAALFAVLAAPASGAGRSSKPPRSMITPFTQMLQMQHEGSKATISNIRA